MDALEQLAQDTDLFWDMLEAHVGDIHGDIFATMVETNGTPEQRVRCRAIYQRRMAEINANIDKEKRVSAVS